MTEYEMAMAALRRPLDYGARPAQSQWNIDSRLGILDWNGIDIDKARGVVEQDDIATSNSHFGMTIGQLAEVIEGFDKQDLLWKEMRAKEKEAKDEH